MFGVLCSFPRFGFTPGTANGNSGRERAVQAEGLRDVRGGA